MIRGIYRSRWLRLTLSLLFVNTLLLSMVIFRSHSTQPYCLVNFFDQDPNTLFDSNAGMTWALSGNNFYYPIDLHSVSHNGKYVAYLKENSVGARVYSLVIENIATGETLRQVNNITHGSHYTWFPALSLEWSPDDRYLAYGKIELANGTLQIYGLENNTPVYQYDGSLDSYAWASDSVELANMAHGDTDTVLKFWDFRQAKIASFSYEHTFAMNPTWAPDRSVLAYIEAGYDQRRIPFLPFELVLANPTRGQITRIAVSSDTSFTLVWSPDGRYLRVNDQLFRIEKTSITRVQEALHVEATVKSIWSGQSLVY
jgi:WD40 repeat protein